MGSLHKDIKDDLEFRLGFGIDCLNYKYQKSKIVMLYLPESCVLLVQLSWENFNPIVLILRAKWWAKWWNKLK